MANGADGGIQRTERSAPVSRWLAVLAVSGSLAFATAGIVLYGVKARRVNLVSLQMARSKKAAGQLVVGHVGEYRSAIHWDGVLLAGYGAGLTIACLIGRSVFNKGRSRTLATVGLGLTWLAIAANGAQDELVLKELPDPSKHLPVVVQAIAGLGLMKFTALLFAAAVAATATSVTTGRLWNSTQRHGGRRPVKEGNEPDLPQLVPPGVDAEIRLDGPNVYPGPAHGETMAHWSQVQVPPGRKLGELGICLSGGGVRSATVALGALQALQAGGELTKARYIVSVSGGGYMAGAFQLLLADHHDGGVHEPTDNPYRPGSAEEDYNRRHSSYLADGPGQWVVALGTLARNLLLSLGLGALAVIAVGIGVAAYYRSTQLALFQKRSSSTGLTQVFEPHFLANRTLVFGPMPAPAAGPATVMGIAAGLAVLAYVAAIASPPSTRKRWWIDWIKQAAVWLGVLALALAFVGAILPALIWTGDWVTWHVAVKSPKTVSATAGIIVALTYVGALAASLWRKKTTYKATVADVGSAAKKVATAALPNSMVQMLLMWVCLVLLVLFYALGATWIVTSGLASSWWAVLPLGLYGAFWLMDQTWMSLHPFYRRRLASAYAVKRRPLGTMGTVVAEAYEASTRTSLHDYAQKIDDFPQIIFQATANVTGQDLTPPGRRAVSYTLASDYIGGPRLGWIKTSTAQESFGEHIARDLTVEAAVAISGAAFASALGDQTRFYETFLALANARLGAWLPNPLELCRGARAGNDWTLPLIPTTRRLSYFYREIFGMHPSDNPLLLCTDGGHYENEGLVELIRHECALIYCFDATGDSPPSATTLAQAITLAYEETGAEITLDNLDYLVPGSASNPGAFGVLMPRLSKALACRGRVTYQNGKKGTIIFAKTGLVPTMPYELLSYAVRNSIFPRDSTADQWFNVDQFDAYRRLGHQMGTDALKLAGPWVPPSVAPDEISIPSPDAPGATVGPVS